MPSAGATSSRARRAEPLVGIGYRAPIAAWTRAHLPRFDVLEITIDHCIHANASQQRQIDDLVGRVALTAHGIGLSIGTDCPLDRAYLDEVGEIIARLEAPAYSEHLAFTRVPGRDLGNLLPLPRTEAIAERVISRVREVQAHLGVPILLENIAAIFEWPDSTLSDAEFLNLICRETGAGVLLDIENLRLNARNHGLDARAFLDALPRGVVREIHMAGGIAVRDENLDASILADSHSHPVRDEALALLGYALGRHHPAAIIVERDDRLDAADEILADVDGIRAVLAERRRHAIQAERNETGLLERQTELLAYLTSARAIFETGRDAPLPPLLRGIEPVRLGFEARFSHEKRMEKLARVFPHTLRLLGKDREGALREFAGTCPPTGIGILENARQFLAFLTEAWRSRARASPCLRDVARCELALATARARCDRTAGPETDDRRPWNDRDPAQPAVRRAKAVTLVRSAHDVRCIFENSAGAASPPRRDTHLVIAASNTAAEPVIFEVPATVFKLLATLDQWTERRSFGDGSVADALIADLAERGILELRR